MEAINEYKLNVKHVIQYLQMKLLDNPLIMSNSTVSRFLAQNIIDGKGINLIDDTFVRASLRDSSSVIDQVFGEYVHKVWMECTSMLLNFVPVVGSLKAIAEGIVGHDLLTGRQYAWWERAFNIGMGSIALVGEVGLLAVTLKDSRMAVKLSEVATIAGNSAVKAMAEAISKIKAGASDMLEGISKIIKGDGYYEFATPDGMLFRMADEEIPVASRSILDKIADAIRNAINKARAIGITDEAELKRIGENVEQAMKNGSKFTEPTLALGDKPKGVYEAVTGDAEMIRSITRQNEAADFLANEGYNIEMLPYKTNGNGYGVKPSSNPDYLIDGQVFDCYSPKTINLRTIWDTVVGKTENQARRVILNLDDYTGSLDDLAKQFNDWPIDGLDELLVIKDGKIARLFIK
ncbi:hypothetical protein CLHUN_42640 [Ruminiclostridium hungatei]|uniref:tRNA nuclease CdiA C-terminal domain-containing protein n=1 Tax=Ruminiclostridium hungatei TaxID=48256 RepID=A0A1V4SEI6_RUMHU|nr:pre-toxin TG domain-containing protein [Ruminiclostridium hungatei]OPX41865.1 hypothetical protein CLHUN_42640 [Ruminiclostridium hungatei]